MKKIKIPVVFGTDSNYIFPTGVVMASMLANANENTFYDFYIQTTEECIEDCRRVFFELNKKYSNFEINYLIMYPAEFENVSVKNDLGHVTMPTFYRLMIANQLLQYDRCIVLDSDILVRNDLSEMYSVDLSDNYIAGIKSWADQQPTSVNKKHMEIDGLPSMDNFIYLGVLVMNLKKIRDDNLTEKFVFHMSKGYPKDDQDVFNICCYGKIKFLPLKYNLMCRFYKSGFPRGNNIYSQAELKEDVNNPVIIHYPGNKNKPWLNKYVPLADEWWDVAEIFNSICEYSVIKSKQQTYINTLGIDLLLKEIKKGDNLIICGFTDIGKLVSTYIAKELHANVSYFMDNDVNKSDLKYENVIVKTFDSLKSEIDIKSYKYIIANQKSASAIKSQLSDDEILDENIIECKLL